MSKKTAAPTPPRKPLFMRRPNPKVALKNFYISGQLGDTQPDSTIQPAYVITRTPWHALGGFDLEISQRISRLPGGGELVVRIEGRAEVDGRLTVRVINLKNGKDLLLNTSYRDGVPSTGDE